MITALRHDLRYPGGTNAPDCPVGTAAEQNRTVVGPGGAAAADGAPAGIARSKQVVARYFLEQIVPEAAGQKHAALGGAELLYALDAEALAG